MNSVDVTSCSQSQGAPTVRVTMSNVTVVQKQNSSTPHSTISASSRPSSARHFRWRCRGATSLTAMVIGNSACVRERRRADDDGPLPGLLHGLDQILYLHRVGAKFGGEFIEIGICEFLKTGFVDVGDYFDSKRLQLVRRLVLQIDGFGRLLAADLVRGCLHPLFLLIAQTFPQFVADPDQIVVGLVFSH